MAHVRLFANLRELAGVSEVDLSGSTVNEVLASAVDRFGHAFEDGLASAGVWVNGDPARPVDTVGPEDEIAVLPPVSGGAGPGLDLRLIGPFAASLVLLIANALDNPVWFIAALVGVGGVWAWDVSDNGALRPSALRVPLLVAVLAGALIPYAWNVGRGGAGGLGLAVLLTTVSVLIQSVIISANRDFLSAAAAVMASAVTALGVGSLVLARIFTTSGQSWVWVFLLMVIAGRGVAAYLIDRELPLDPLSGGVVATVVGGIAGALIWNLNGFAVFLIAIAIAVVLIAGTAFSSLLSTREVYFARHLPGIVPDIGAAFLAAVLFLPVARLLL
jgi:molybdopterin synthase sulfur carrier subunit